MQPDRYQGHRLSDLVALGRDTVEIACPLCGVDARALPIADLMASFGNVVLPAVISLVTPRCPRRGKPDQIACGAVLARPLSVEEEAWIVARRAV